MSFLISTGEECDVRKTTYFAKLVMRTLADAEIDAAVKTANEDERVDVVAETTDVCKIETSADAADDEEDERAAETRGVEGAAGSTEADKADGGGEGTAEMTASNEADAADPKFSNH